MAKKHTEAAHVLPAPRSVMIDPLDYDFPQGNLARETEIKRARFALYRADFLASALQGVLPSVHTPIMATEPIEGEDGPEIPFVIDGVGRIASVSFWNDRQPAERFADAMALYGAGLRINGKAVSPKEREQITFETLAKSTAFAQSNTGVDPAKVIAAFSAKITSVPALFYDVDEETARKVAHAALVQREEATIFDKLKVFRERPELSQTQVAEFLQIAIPSVNTLAKYAAAQDSGALLPDVDYLAKLHITPIETNVTDETGAATAKTVPHGSPFTLTGLVNKLGLSKKTSRFLKNPKGDFERNTEPKNDPKGSCRVDYSREEQASALNVAYLMAWERDEGQGKPPQVGDQISNDFGRKIQAGDFYKALLDIRATSNAGGDKAESGAEVIPPTKPRERDKRPTLRDMLYFVEPERWEGRRAEPVMEIMRKFVYGHLTASDAAQQIEQATYKRGKPKPEGFKLPTEIAAKLETFVEKAEPESTDKGDGNKGAGESTEASE